MSNRWNGDCGCAYGSVAESGLKENKPNTKTKMKRGQEKMRRETDGRDHSLRFSREIKTHTNVIIIMPPILRRKKKRLAPAAITNIHRSLEVIQPSSSFHSSTIKNETIATVSRGILMGL